MHSLLRPGSKQLIRKLFSRNNRPQGPGCRQYLVARKKGYLSIPSYVDLLKAASLPTLVRVSGQKKAPLTKCISTFRGHEVLAASDQRKREDNRAGGCSRYVSWINPLRVGIYSSRSPVSTRRADTVSNKCNSSRCAFHHAPAIDHHLQEVRTWKVPYEACK